MPPTQQRPAKQEVKPELIAKPEANQGHGWVHPRADKRKENCGGPDSCKVCQEEAKDARAELCDHAQVDNEAIYQCGLQVGHHGRHEYNRRHSSKSVTGYAKKWSEMPPEERLENFDRPDDLPWFVCGPCGYRGPAFKGIEKDHEACEMKSILPPAKTFDPKAQLGGYLIIKSKEGSYGIVHQVVEEGAPLRQTVLRNREDWDITIQALTGLAAEMPTFD